MLLLLVFINLFKLQVIQRDLKRQGGPWVKVVSPVPRGTIYDRNGQVLAMSVPYCSVYLDSWAISEKEKDEKTYKERLKKELQETLGLQEKQINKYLSLKYPLIEKELSLNKYKELESKNLPGIVFEQRYKRVYPNNRFACHVIGFTGTDEEGLEGIELYYNSILKGMKGVSLILKDGKGALIPSVEKKLVEPEKGKDIKLTLDYKLQFIVEEELEKCYAQYNAKSASAVIMNYENGEILALANYPNYDLNFFKKANPAERRNRIVTDLFEPGSTFKIITVTAAMEEKLIAPEDTVFCENGRWFVRNHFLRDTHSYGHLTVREVLEKSSNIGTVKIAMKLGESRLYDYCNKFGFGQLTGIDLPGEVRGILRPLNRWSGYSITAIPIGQEVGTTAIQGIVAMGVTANGGYLVKPHILKEIQDKSADIKTLYNQQREQILSEKTCTTLTNILENVTKPGGTAPKANIDGYRISGKTGTAQKSINGRYSKNQYVASFCGYINGTEEKLVIMVTVDEPRPIYYGGLVAAPTFKNILWRSLQYFKIPPHQEYNNNKIVLNKKEPVIKE